MKITAKVISSPGRTDKFPPPLMRFLRSNAGSRSRGRSRTSPMFVRKNKSNTAIETQEPSSPKVTCMGQVRVRRSSAAKRGHSSSASAARDGAPLPPTRCRCWWIRNNALFCRLKPNKKKTKKKKKQKNESRCQPVWPKWGFFRVGSFRRKPGTKLKEECAKSESNFQKSSYGESEADHEEEEEDDESEILEERVNPEAGFGSSKTPPKNALLLTRCRSAPYRSSSLACRFWSSPLRNNEQQEQEQEEKNEGSPQRDSVSEEEEPKREGKLGILMKQVENSNSKSESERAAGIMLTRCKSEPARSGYKVDPDQVNSSFWKTKNTSRLRFADTLHIITH
ncbi:hypothetical protein PIB30_006703 [Stylosanthes scabra]|uniref:Uncharacterized protein n=1 Tax=Stylosanthes scabra TaxID=79078 RepID=A0ABU6S4S6_9FABA|nr:hypothetical protein [Stylosanthes scabra]